ncbi:phosphatidate cytidylyltransferase [Thermoactinomyces daqus]|uniref:Phosphatidate cytidylyltransferase n=1 Tax=Thermoactinomyces daqus TaxID=1329516 RepID=A0A7W1XCI5_9BACL|nr:phosphatidate cytidylyltransferase [Thermoactinomyces daqus]MBA4544058.1 phosphatidate cytidylyltransferase [Thermoactinomyces daqus]
MKQRIITGGLGALGFLLLLSLGGWWYTALMFVLAVIAFLEFAQMREQHWKTPQMFFGLIVIALIFLSGLMELPVLKSSSSFLKEPNPLLLGLALYSVLIVLSRNRFDLFQMAYLLAGAIYIGYGFLYMMVAIWKPDGLALSLLVIIVTWANDSGAYFIGKKWGKHKLWPQISPNKTIQGSLGGIMFGIVTSLVIWLIHPQLGSSLWALGMGLFITIVGQLGDLVESAWKRSAGVKDSGGILPGHGGVLDRFDSLLFVFLILHLIQAV